MTGKTVLPQVHMERVLSVMSTCGMYDAAGEWVASVGMAAKSGVGGGIVAVLPGQLALAVFSPRLDEHGNSVRGVKACRQLSQDLELHALHVTRAAHGAIRDSYDILEAPSAMQRPQADRDVLEVYGRRARIYEVHGDLLFSGAESVVREIAEAGDDLELLVLDVRRIGDVSDVARRLLASLRASLLERELRRRAGGPRRDVPRRTTAARPELQVFPTLQAATVWCEDRLLERYGDDRAGRGEFELADHPLLQDVPQELVDELERRMEPREYAGRRRDRRAGRRRGRRVPDHVRPGAVVADHGGRRDPPAGPADAGHLLRRPVRGHRQPHPLTMHAVGHVRLLELTRDQYDAICQRDAELRAELLHLFMFAIHDDWTACSARSRNGRVTPMTAT